MDRPDILTDEKNLLSRIERAQIAFVRRTFEPGLTDRAVRFCQRTIGAYWITTVTDRLRHVHGVDRLPPLDPGQSFVLASNHRSFFDLYVVIAHMMKHVGLPHRIVFPVRSEFFYDNPAGLFVNGAMSFFAMYPPIFRDRKRAALNLLSLEELAWMLRRGGVFVGIHPEGTRGKDSDPYTLLPAQSGVGRIVHQARVPVIPVFVNGLINDFPKQVTGNFDGSGTDVHIVFGKPLELDDLLDKRGAPKTYKAIANRMRDVITELGQEEKRLRAESSKVKATG